MAQQRQKTEKIEKETEKIKALLDAEREKEVERIDIQKRIQVSKLRCCLKHVERKTQSVRSRWRG